MTRNEIRNHRVTRDVYKQLESLKHHYTFEPEPSIGPYLDEGVFKIYNLKWPVQIRLVFIKGGSVQVVLNGKNISSRPLSELGGLILEAIEPAVPAPIKKESMKPMDIRKHPTVKMLNQMLFELAYTVQFKEDDRIAPLAKWVLLGSGTLITVEPLNNERAIIRVDGVRVYDAEDTEALENLIKNSAPRKDGTWWDSPEEEKKDTAEFKYVEGQDVKWLPSGKVCSFISYTAGITGCCTIQVYGGSTKRKIVKLTDIEPWHESRTLFSPESTVVNVRTKQTGKYVGPCTMEQGMYLSWVLFDNEQTPSRVNLKYIEPYKAPESAGRDISPFSVEINRMKKAQNNGMAERKNEGKLEWSLVDFEALEPLVLGLMKGSEKYSPNNWKKGLKCSKIMESLMRHYVAIMQGELIDEETGVPHIGLLMCNAMFYSWTIKNRPELIDIVKYVKS